MRLRFKKNKPRFSRLRRDSRGKQKGIIPAILALIIGAVSIVILVLVLALIVYFNHIIAGLIGGGQQPGGNCNVGCGFDESKVNFYTHGDAPNVDATSEEAKNFAIDTLKVESSQIVAFDKSAVENMIRAEIASQWAKLSTEQQHGATQADAQHAILAYQYHEDSSFQMFVNSGGRLVPKHDSTTIQLMSISIDKYQGNKRKEIALNWDIKYTIYTGVKENISAFLNNASGSGAERWKQAIGFVFLPSNPSCYWNCSRAVCRCASANEGWEKYKNEVSYNCQSATNCGAVSGSGPCGQNLVNIATAELGTREEPPGSDCVPYNHCDHVAWCDTFVNWVYMKAGYDYFYKNFFESFDESRHYMQKYQTYIDVSNGDTSQIRPGDYFWTGGDDIRGRRHAGMVKSVSGKEVRTIEGNSGKMVKEQTRKAGSGFDDIKAVARLKSCSL